jgi:hypothetical protein
MNSFNQYGWKNELILFFKWNMFWAPSLLVMELGDNINTNGRCSSMTTW